MKRKPVQNTEASESLDNYQKKICSMINKLEEIKGGLNKPKPKRGKYILLSLAILAVLFLIRFGPEFIGMTTISAHW